MAWLKIITVGIDSAPGGSTRPWRGSAPPRRGDGSERLDPARDALDHLGRRVLLVRPVARHVTTRDQFRDQCPDGAEWLGEAGRDLGHGQGLSTQLDDPALVGGETGGRLLDQRGDQRVQGESVGTGLADASTAGTSPASGASPAGPLAALRSLIPERTSLRPVTGRRRRRRDPTCPQTPRAVTYDLSPPRSRGAWPGATRIVRDGSDILDGRGGPGVTGT